MDRYREVRAFGLAVICILVGSLTLGCTKRYSLVEVKGLNGGYTTCPLPSSAGSRKGLPRTKTASACCLA